MARRSAPRSTTTSPKPRHARGRPSDRPPPESAALRERAAVHESTFADGPTSNDELAERMGEAAVRAMTSGQDDDEPVASSDETQELELDSLFVEEEPEPELDFDGR